MELVRQTAMPRSQRLAAWLETPLLQRGLTALILINAVILGLETSSTLMASWGELLSAADKAITRSARTNIDCGMVSPSAVAVFRLITSW